jgi:hypothetical protein
MIKIEKNENFKGWLNIFVGGFLVEQINGRANALKIAKQIAQDRGEKNFLFLNFIIDSKE